MRATLLLLLSASCIGDSAPTTKAEPLADLDGDGFTEDVDCDDSLPSVNPDAPEICSGIDEDCDGLVDELDDSLTDGTTVYEDADGDGHGDPALASVTCDASGGLTLGDDCDDTSAEVAPGVPDRCEDGIDQDCSGSDEPCLDNLLPVAPTSTGTFMWQGVQTAFTGDGQSCTGSLVMAMGDQVFCYVDTSGDGELFCAGRTFTQTWGPSFVSTGLRGVQQIWHAPTVNQENGNSTCALVQGVPTCLGLWNFSGQLGNGSTASSDTWTAWSAGSGLQHLASGTSDSFCGPTASGDVWCTGYNYGLTPVIAGQTSQQSVWIDGFGTLHLDDPVVLRVSQGRSECTIDSDGLNCPYIYQKQRWGRPGHVVDGGMIQTPNFDVQTLVWLEDDGTVWRGEMEDTFGASPTIVQHFTDMPVLAIAYHYYTDTFCGIYNDGSLVCYGSNSQGKLGTGAVTPLTQDTVVLPAGTFDPHCEP